MSAVTPLTVGSSGRDVLMIQRQLRKIGYNIRDDGRYSPQTAAAVADFQRKRQFAVSGIVGAQTYYVLTGKRPVSAAGDVVPEPERRNIGGYKFTAHSGNGSREAVFATESVSLSPAYAAWCRQLLTSAYQYLGVPYVPGGSSPNGFDCSGFTKYVFSHCGISLPRQADAQFQVGMEVARERLSPGDLVFFSTYTEGISHAGIYVGNNQFISATTSSGIRVDRLDSAYWAARYVGAKRIYGQDIS